MSAAHPHPPSGPLPPPGEGGPASPWAYAQPVQPAAPTAAPPPPPIAYGSGYGYGGPVGASPWMVPAIQAGRPGLMTAIGVFSIIVAAVTMIASFGTGMYGLSMLRMRQVSQTVGGGARVGQAGPPASVMSVAPTAPPARGGLAIPAELQVGPRGLMPDDRQAVAHVLQQLIELPPERLRQLDAILTQAGQDVFPTLQPTQFKAVRIAAAVTDHGTLPSADPKDPDPVYFQTSSGQLELYRDRALFRPRTPGAAQVRASAPAPAAEPVAPPAPSQPPSAVASGPPPAPGQPVDPFASDDDPFAAPAGAGDPALPVPTGSGTALGAAQVQAVIQKIQAAAGNKLSAAQVAALQQELSVPTQTLVPPAAAWSPVGFAQVQPDGTAVLKLAGGYLVIDPQGTVTDAGATNLPTMRIHPLSISTVMAESVVSFVLAGLLLTAGVLALKQSPRARRLHLVYAIAKLPVAVAGAVGLAWLGSEMLSNVAQMSRGGTGPDPAGVRTFGIVTAVLALIYPVALLIALNTPGVRAYYKGMRQ